MRTREQDAAVISGNLKRLLAEKNITQADLAKAIGENRTTVNMWVAGKAIPRFPKFAKLAEFFGCRVSDITEPYMIELDFEKISEDERKIIIEYRKADSMTKEMVKRTLSYTQQLFGDDTGKTGRR